MVLARVLELLVALMLVLAEDFKDIPSDLLIAPIATTSFFSDTVLSLCTTEDFSCKERIMNNFLSIKLADFYLMRSSLTKYMSNVLGRIMEQEFLEGGIETFPDKVSSLALIANDIRVETICEIGFNAGYSAMNFLLSNPRASIISFDIFRHDYSAVAVRALHDFFPNRTLVTIAGDSASSVPKFLKAFPQHKCNLLFIDGSHAQEALQEDIMNFKLLANESFHVLVIDDMHDPSLQEVYSQFVVNRQDMIDDITSKVIAGHFNFTTESESIISAKNKRVIEHVMMQFTPRKTCLSWNHVVPQSATSVWETYVEFTVPDYCGPQKPFTNGIAIARYV